jgi:hypothetical protein
VGSPSWNTLYILWTCVCVCVCTLWVNYNFYEDIRLKKQIFLQQFNNSPVMFTVLRGSVMGSSRVGCGWRASNWIVWPYSIMGSYQKVFENRVLRRIFGPKRDEELGDWRRLHNKGLNDFYSPPNIIPVIKSRRMRWAGHVARMGQREVHTGFWWRDPREGDHLGDPGLDGRIIFKYLRSGMAHGLDWAGSE